MASMRNMAYTVLGFMALLAVWLTFQHSSAATYRDDPRNVRSFDAPESGRRGEILSADGVVLARDTETGGREYPGGAVWAHVVGSDHPSLDATGLEATRRSDMLSRDDGSITAFLTSLFGGDLGPPSVQLTVNSEVQAAAAAALGSQKGAVVAIDPRTGAVLAYVSSPSFDPNTLPDTSGVLIGDIDQPLRDRVAGATRPPGSTFKILVAGAGMETLGLTTESLLTDSAEYVAPGAGTPINNAAGGVCGDGSTVSLMRAITVSCNTAFARLAVEMGAGPLVDLAERAGFNGEIPWELTVVASQIPEAVSLDADPPALAQTALGERDVRATPLQMALIAAAVANDGVAMAPQVVRSVVAPDGEVLDAFAPARIGRVFPSEVATALGQMMVEVVLTGTGRAAGLPEIQVAGKTGTAAGAEGPHAWFIGFAPADDPVVAIAVLVESGGRLGDGGTGGSVAAPIAAAVIDAVVRGG
jgi:peptidoglycan glycosyltransferase